MGKLSIQERARKYVAKMPAAVSGAGGHDATFHVACVLLQGFDLPRGEARSVLDEYNARCEPPWSDRELEHKLNQADKMAGLVTRDGTLPRGCMAADSERDDGPAEPRLPSKAPSAPVPMALPKKPEFDAATLKRFAARWRPYVDTVWLAERSPVMPFGVTAAQYLAHVFREGERVVLFTNQQSQGQALWPLQAVPVGGDEGVWYLGQPVDGEAHVNPRAGRDKDGEEKYSRRSEESVTDWRHLVIESDQADPRDWMGAVVQLPLRIVAIYTSGKRSIHALARIDAPTKGEWDNVVKQLRPMLVTLGADPKAMSAVRLTRLPGCLRGRALQKLLFLNPEATGAPLCALPKAHDVQMRIASWLNAVPLVTAGTPAEAAEVCGEEMLAELEAGLAWFATSPGTAEALAKLLAWKGGGE